MKLCFGVFATILRHCLKKLNQEKLVARLAKCVDTYSGYIDESVRCLSDATIEGDKSAISKLVNCKKNFVFSESEVNQVLDFDMVIKNLNTHIIPFIEDKGKIKFILAIIRVIQLDGSIDLEEREVFKKAFGVSKEQFLEQGEYDFSDILGKTLLYTVDSDIENIKGAGCIKVITKDFVEKELDFSIYDYEWDSDKSSLKLFRYIVFNLFNEILLKYNINDFIETADPTNCIDLSKWIENGDEFIEETKNQIWNKYNQNSTIVKEAQTFAQVLNDYLNYLALNMRPANERTSISVPLYRDEDVKWGMNFEKTVMDFRLEMISVYKNIVNSVMRNIDN